MRKVASGWEDDYAQKLVGEGFKRGRAAPTLIVLYLKETTSRRWRRYHVPGTESEVRGIQTKLCEWYHVKVRGILGSGKRDMREMDRGGVRVQGEKQEKMGVAGEELKTVHGSAVKAKKEAVYKCDGNFKPHQLGQVRRAVRCERKFPQGCRT